MSDNAAATTRPVVVQFTVTLTALVYPEPDAGGYSAEYQHSLAATLRARHWRKREPIFARRSKAGWPLRMTKHWPAPTCVT
jgi:hypothetical protein